VGTTNVIETTTELDEGSAWQPACQVTMTNLFQTFACPGATNRTQFFRAVRRSEP
jgi:hypothetical protein